MKLLQVAAGSGLLVGTGCYLTGPRPAAPVLGSPVAVAVLVGAALALATLLARLLRQYWLTRPLPGLSPSYPLLGNFLQLAGPQEDLMEKILGWLKGRDILKVWIGPLLGVVVNNPQDLQVVFTHTHLQNKAHVYHAIQTILDEGLLNMDYPAYRRHRKAITPSLHLEVLRSFVPRFGYHGHKFEESLQPFAESGEVFDALHMCERVISCALSDTILCTDISGLEAERDAVIKNIQLGSNLIMYAGLRPWLQVKPLFRLLSSRYHETQRLYALLQDFVGKVLDRKEASIRKRKEEATQEEPEFKELLEHILTSKEGSLLSKQELTGELKHVMIAGIATSSDLMSLFMLVLALRPDIQDNVHKELDEVFGADPARPVLAADLPNLQYLERTIKEVMRFFPLVPLYARHVDDDVLLPSGAVLPAGGMAMVFPRGVHWDARWYPNPTIFNPDHFLPENIERRPNFSFIPFGAGSRVCIGQRYGFMFAKAAAATYLRQYRFLPAPTGIRELKDLKLVIGMSLQVQGGVNVRVERRVPRTAP